MPPRSPNNSELDMGQLRESLATHPVRLAVLFGSVVRNDTHPKSDVDVAVEFDETVEDEKQEWLSLLADLSIALGRNDVDISLVRDLKPAVGLEAFKHGRLVVGSGERMETYRERFEREVERFEADRPSLRERFDAVIEGVDEALQGST